MRLEDADGRSIDILDSQPEHAIILVLARQDPTSSIRLPHAIRYPFPRAPFRDIFLRRWHGVEGHADPRWFGREFAGRAILGRGVGWARGVGDDIDGAVVDGGTCHHDSSR